MSAQPRKRVDLSANDIIKGDPAALIIGRQEQPARIHRPLEPKPKRITVDTVMYEIECRMEELYPAYAEYLRLNQAVIELLKIK